MILPRFILDVFGIRQGNSSEGAWILIWRSKRFEFKIEHIGKVTLNIDKAKMKPAEDRGKWRQWNVHKNYAERPLYMYLLVFYRFKECTWFFLIQNCKSPPLISKANSLLATGITLKKTSDNKLKYLRSRSSSEALSFRKLKGRDLVKVWHSRARHF